MISLDLYRIFIIVADEKNITKASKILHISQPAITKYIHNLENQLQIKLFTRSKTGVTLTEAGQNIYDQIKDSINILSNIENTIISPKEIKYGARTAIFNYLFQDVFYEFSKQYPEYSLLSFKDSIPEMLKKLNNFELDIVLTKKPLIDTSNYPNIKFVKLGVLHDIFVTKKHSKYTNKTYTKNDLRNEIIYTNAKISISNNKLLSILDLPSNSTNVIPLNSFTTLKRMLLESDAIGFITKECITNELNEGLYKIIKTNFELGISDFGFYYNINNKFDILTKLMKYLKENI